jgi:type IV pilus assembly protein PilN
MRITLNLATRPFADLGPAIKRLRIAMAFLAVAAIGLVLGLRAFDKKAEDARARERSLDSQIARITQERQGYQDLMSLPANAQLLKQAEALNKLFDNKAFSWTLAMEDLETVLPGGVQVATLDPIRDAKTGVITLHLRVIGPRDRAIELVRNLEHSKRFLLPRVVSENSEAAGGPNERVLTPVSASNRVDFDLLADYNPAEPGERKSARQAASAAGNPDTRNKRAPHPAHALPGPISPQIGSPAQLPVRPPYTGPPAQPITTRPSPGGPNPDAGGRP